MFLTWICIAATLCSSCNNDLIEYRKGDIKVSIEAGDAYLHDFPLFMGIKRKNAPQMAVWIEDMQGNYLSTIYVTDKIANQSWAFAGGNRRKEALRIGATPEVYKRKRIIPPNQKRACYRRCLRCNSTRKFQPETDSTEGTQTIHCKD